MSRIACCLLVLAGITAAIAAGVGYLSNNWGVTMLTRTSVHWADRIVATSSSKALWWSNAHVASG